MKHVLRLIAVVSFALLAVSLPTVSAQASSSGTTGMGYGWNDSGAFDWIELAPPAAKLMPLSSCDDCVQQGVDIGFSFPFFGVTHQTVSIGANGSLMFGNTSTQWGPGSIPSDSFGSAAMLPFWSDWDLGARGDAYAGPAQWPAAGGQPAFVIEWKDVESWDCDDDDVGTATWEVILVADGSFVFQYKDATLGDDFCDGGSDMTVAIQRDALDCFITYKNQMNTIADGTAVFWSPQADRCSGNPPTATATTALADTPTPASTATQAAAYATPAVATVASPVTTPVQDSATPGSGTASAVPSPEPAGRAGTTAQQATLGANRAPTVGYGPQRQGDHRVPLHIGMLMLVSGAIAVAGGVMSGLTGRRRRAPAPSRSARVSRRWRGP